MPKVQSENDRRVRKTRRALTNALIELVQERDYDSITVQDIIDKADVGRSTFYTHYRDKEDLFRGDWKRFLELIVGHVELESIEHTRVFPISQLFEHLKEFHPFYRGLLRSGQVDRIFTYGQKYMAKLLEGRLNIVSLKAEPVVPTEILANYLSTEVFAILKWWLDHNMPYTPDRMDKIFHALVIPGVRECLAPEKTAS